MKKLLLTALLLPSLAFAEDITIQNLVRAESDTMFRLGMQQYDIGIGEIAHIAQGRLRQRTTAGDPTQPGHALFLSGD